MAMLAYGGAAGALLADDSTSLGKALILKHFTGLNHGETILTAQVHRDHVIIGVDLDQRESLLVALPEPSMRGGGHTAFKAELHCRGDELVLAPESSRTSRLRVAP